jgi:serine/threonine-protein kinase
VTDPNMEREALALFDALLDQPEDERDAWFDRATHGRADLRARVDALRLADRRAAIRTGGAQEAAEEAPPPERLGGYRLGERIGRGGMGSVYRAERDRGDFTHVAAIKIIKPGLLSQSLVERFRRERQVLARLTHPGIAQLLDGGETEDGAPYIVMEYVPGRSLLEWMEQQRPSLAGRLALFREACAAVAFAHANLVVHRDITPSNILVTAEGHAKLIDFGIARPFDAAADAAPVSSSASLSLTPGYAAPERMTSEAVTTATDIYSLGKVLERLLPPVPPPELAAIVARATAHAPQDRYPTVEALARDVRAFERGEPVTAYSTRRRYRAAKFVRRNRAGVATAAAMLLLLVVAVALTSWSYLRAERARVDAERRFAETRAIANTLLFDVYDEVSRVPGSTRARALLARTGVRYLDTLARQRGGEPDVQAEVGRGYTRLAQVTGGGQAAQLGRYKDADALLAQATAVLAPLHAAHPGDRTVARAYAALLVEQAGVSLYNNSKPDEARTQAQRARAVLRGQERANAEAARLWAAALQAEGDSWAWGDDYARAAQLYAEVDPFVASLPPAWRNGRPIRAVRAATLRLLGEAEHKRDRGPQAIAALDAAVVLNRALNREDPGDPQTLRRFIISLWYRAVVLRTRMQDARAAESIGEAMANARTMRARDGDDEGALQLFAAVGEVQAQVLGDQRRFAESFALTDQVIDVQTRRAALGGNAAGSIRSLASALRIGGGNFYNGGDFAGACARWARAIALYRGLKARGDLSAGLQKSLDELDGWTKRGCNPPRSLGVKTV